MPKCKMCGKETTAVVNINFKAVPLCDHCACSIAVQQVHWWAQGGTSQSKVEQRSDNTGSLQLLLSAFIERNTFLEGFQLTILSHFVSWAQQQQAGA